MIQFRVSTLDNYLDYRGMGGQAKRNHRCPYERAARGDLPRVEEEEAV